MGVSPRVLLLTAQIGLVCGKVPTNEAMGSITKYDYISIFFKLLKLFAQVKSYFINSFKLSKGGFIFYVFQNEQLII